MTNEVEYVHFLRLAAFIEHDNSTTYDIVRTLPDLCTLFNYRYDNSVAELRGVNHLGQSPKSLSWGTSIVLPPKLSDNTGTFPTLSNIRSTKFTAP